MPMSSESAKTLGPPALLPELGVLGGVCVVLCPREEVGVVATGIVVGVAVDRAVAVAVGVVCVVLPCVVEFGGGGTTGVTPGLVGTVVGGVFVGTVVGGVFVGTVVGGVVGAMVGGGVFVGTVVAVVVSVGMGVSVGVPVSAGTR